jgi:peptidoglycan/xylan/chitin deacetylase (PgdA/CDA1 family)
MSLPISPLWSVIHLGIKFPGVTALLATAYFAAPIVQEAIREPRPMVAFTFDDGFRSAHDVALPALTERGWVGTNYVTLNFLDSGPRYINTEQLTDFVDAGWEIGAHTLDHSDLTKLNEADLAKQLREPYFALNQIVGDVQSFSSPYGEFNGMVLDHARSIYSSHVNAYGPKRGVNSPTGFYAYNIDRIDTAHISVAEICTTVSNLDNELYVMIFHRIGENEDQVVKDQYNISVDDFTAILDCVKAAKVDVVTVTEGATETLARSLVARAEEVAQ